MNRRDGDVDLHGYFRDGACLVCEGDTAMSECPFCGRDPFHYVDNGVGMEAVAVTCCDLGDLYFRGARPAPDEVTLSWEDFTKIGDRIVSHMTDPRVEFNMVNGRFEVCPSPSSDCQVKCGLESCAEEESKMTGKSCQPMTEHTPTPWRVEKDTDLIWGACNPDDLSSYGMGYAIVEGKKPSWKPYKPDGEEREANAAFIVKAVNSHAALLSRAEQDATRIEDLEAALRCISTPADVSKMKARIEDLEVALREIKQATLTGRVCDDVAWFDSITTLHDFCDLVLNGPNEAESTR